MRLVRRPEPTVNPWLTTAPVEVTAEPARELPAVHVHGPQAHVPAPDLVDALPVHPMPVTAGLWVVGVHGGAGESTLADLDPVYRAAGHVWPTHPDGTGVHVVLAARTTHRGLTAAQNAARQWAAGLVPHVTLHGLILTPDTDRKLPRPLADLAHRVGGGVPRVWTMPWDENTRRYGINPTGSAYLELAGDLGHLLSEGHHA